MVKVFYTEKDIEDLVKQGIFSLEVNDNVVLTDLAYEKAHRLGMRLLRGSPDNPPGAPVRPYLSQNPASSPGAPSTSGGSTPRPTTQAAGSVPPPLQDGAALQQRIRSAVVARLGNQVDANLLDVIIRRVLNQTGVK